MNGMPAQPVDARLSAAVDRWLSGWNLRPLTLMRAALERLILDAACSPRSARAVAMVPRHPFLPESRMATGARPDRGVPRTAGTADRRTAVRRSRGTARRAGADPGPAARLVQPRRRRVRRAVRCQGGDRRQPAGRQRPRARLAARVPCGGCGRAPCPAGCRHRGPYVAPGDPAGQCRSAAGRSGCAARQAAPGCTGWSVGRTGWRAPATGLSDRPVRAARARSPMWPDRSYLRGVAESPPGAGVKRRSLELLDLRPGHCIVDVGSGPWRLTLSAWLSAWGRPDTCTAWTVALTP